MMEVLHHPIAILAIALILDLIFGDPVYRCHPIRLIGNLLSLLERILRKVKLDGYIGGILLFVILAILSLGTYWFIMRGLDAVSPILGLLWRIYACWSFIALGDLCKHGRRIADAVKADDLDGARQATQMLVSRDVTKMDHGACCRAGIESISENLTDGILAPMFFYFLLGIPGLLIFKVVSTMDSMVGYKNEKYLRFGWCGARLDDVLNFIPARLGWLIMSFVALVLPGFHGLASLRTGWRLHHILPSPNSGWTEAAAAGALNLQLVGPIWRDGELCTEIWLGEETARKDTQAADIIRMSRLATATTLFAAALGAAFMLTCQYFLTV